MWKKYTFKDNCKIAYWFYKGSKIGSSVFTITSKNIQLAQKMLDVRLLINKWWDSKREIGPSLKCIWYKVIMWSTHLPRTWTHLTLARGAFVGLTNLTLKKKEKSKKKISRKGLSQKSKKLILTIKYQFKDTFDVSPFLFILHAMVHPILIKLFKFTAFPSLFFTKFGNVLISNKRVTELHKKIIKCF